MDLPGENGGVTVVPSVYHNNIIECVHEPDYGVHYNQLVQEFRNPLHHREGEKLDEWLAKVTVGQIHELQSFVFGVERDKAAVVAELTHPQKMACLKEKSIN